MNRAAIVGVLVAVIGGCAVCGCSGGSASDGAQASPSVSLPAGYVDPMTAADREFKCLEGTQFNALDAAWTTTRIGKVRSDPQEITIGGTRPGGAQGTLKLRRETWTSELRPVGAESKRILAEYKCPVTW